MTVDGGLGAIGVARIFDWGGANHKLHAMTSSEIFKRETFCGTKISLNERSKTVAFWCSTRISVKEEGQNQSLESAKV